MVDIVVKVLIAVAMLAGTASPAQMWKTDTYDHYRHKRTTMHRPNVHHVAEAVPAPVPSPAPVPPAHYPAGPLTESQVANYARSAGFPEVLIDDMVRIAYRESNFCPTAVNGHGCAGDGFAYPGGPACGLWQLFRCPGPSYLDPMVNAWGARAKCLASIASGYDCLRPWGE